MTHYIRSTPKIQMIIENYLQILEKAIWLKFITKDLKTRKIL